MARRWQCAREPIIGVVGSLIPVLPRVSLDVPERLIADTVTGDLLALGHPGILVVGFGRT